MTNARPLLFTIGHSTRSMDDFLAVLRAHGVETLANVRTIPRSRHNPQFSRQSLGSAVPDAGIDFLHLPGPRQPLLAHGPCRGSTGCKSCAPDYEAQ